MNPQTQQKKEDNISHEFKQTKLVHKGKWLHYLQTQIKLKNGKSVIWEHVKRPFGSTDTPTGGTVIPVTNQSPRRVILQANYRYPIKKYCLEFPSGLMDQNQDILTACSRQLKQETGYIGQQFKDSPISIQHAFIDPWKSNQSTTTALFEIKMEENTNPKTQLEDEEQIKLEFVRLDNIYDDCLKLCKEKNYAMSNEVRGIINGMQIAKFFGIANKADEKYCLEFPGGNVDQNEEILKTCARQLKQETGYIGQQFKDSPISLQHAFHDPWKSNQSTTTALFEIKMEENTNPKTQLEQDQQIKLVFVRLDNIYQDCLSLCKEKGYAMSNEVREIINGIEIAKFFGLSK